MNRRLYMPDGVRVIAMGLIMWFHIWQQSWLAPRIQIAGLALDLSAEVRTGYIMVDIMLLLSGYLLFLPVARGGDLPAGEFYKKRLIRILPSYYLCLAVMLLIFALPGGEYASQSAMWKDILTHITFTHTFFSETYVSTRLNVVLWTLAIEMQFYLLFPLISRAFRARPMACYAVMTIIAVAFRRVAAAQESLDLYINQLPAMLDIYANGMMAALIVSGFERRPPEKSSQIFFTAVLLFAFWGVFQLIKAQYAASFPLEARKAAQLQNRYALGVLGALILISGENSFLYIRKLFGNRLTRFLSDVSFNAYIWHQVLAVKLKIWKVPNYVSDSPNAAGEAPWQLLYTVLCFALSIALATAITFLFDRPVTKKLTKICARRP